MVFSMIAIAFLGWVVWGHHMFQTGMNPTLGMAFMVSTMVIAVPSAIKTFNWLGTLWGGNIRFTTPMLNALAFVSMFVIGGLSGIFMAATPVDIFIHDTYFIVAPHPLRALRRQLFAHLRGDLLLVPEDVRPDDERDAGQDSLLSLTFIFFNCTFFPMHILGIGGHMRRIYNPTQYEFLQPLQPMQRVHHDQRLRASALSQIPSSINFFYSMFAGTKAEQNPWQANTLEWEAPTPPPHGNFLEQPVVYRGPYEYSSPEVKEDWLPQNRKLGPGRGGRCDT